MGYFPRGHHGGAFRGLWLIAWTASLLFFTPPLFPFAHHCGFLPRCYVDASRSGLAGGQAEYWDIFDPKKSPDQVHTYLVSDPF